MAQPTPLGTHDPSHPVEGVPLNRWTIWRQIALRFSIVLTIGMSLLAGCTSLPSLDGRSESTVLTDTASTPLGKAVSPQLALHPGQSGIHALADAHDAFAARLLLARAAERSLDVQYYIWRKDLTGTLLFDALHAAAERGVRVRLLLDDNNTAGLDSTLAALDSHPNIEVRLFNPFVFRRLRPLSYLTDFSRVNRRMHNKSFTADKQATIIGGRNVGDEYFGATDGVLFADLDVIAIGPVVDDVSKDFDRYWASGSSYPVARLLKPASVAALEEFRRAASQVANDPAAAEYRMAVRESPFIDDLLAGRFSLQWSPTRMLSDSPDKGLGLADADAMLLPGLLAVIDDAKTSLNIVSPYFVPTRAGVKMLSALTAHGVQVTVLTNALEATDVAVVHAGYAKYRKALLKAGVRLYELRRSAGHSDKRKTPHRAGTLLGGSSATSLHAKTFSVDHVRVFVGSFNFDPRSAQLNTELGFIIEDPVMAHEIDATFDTVVPASAYEVRLSDDGQLRWIDRSDGQLVESDTEPGSSIWLRGWIRLLGMLPIEWLL
jgi:putative cardiolipin synthase